jgi:hypothetical protein
MIITNRRKPVETTSRATSPIHRKSDLLTSATVTTITPTFISRTFPGCSRSLSLKSRDTVLNTKLFYNNNNLVEAKGESIRRKSFESGIDRLSSSSGDRKPSSSTLDSSRLAGDDENVDEMNRKNSQRQRKESINSNKSSLSLGKKCKYYNNLSYNRTLSRENSFIVVDNKNKDVVMTTSTTLQSPLTKNDIFSIKSLL